MRKKTSLKDIAVIGLALFAMFFGAGNLIFPPYLGTNAGSEWFIGFMCFFIADVGLALVAILSMIKGGDVSIQGVTKKLGAVPSVIINTLVVLCIWRSWQSPVPQQQHLKWALCRFSPKSTAGFSAQSSSVWFCCLPFAPPALLT